MAFRSNVSALTQHLPHPLFHLPWLYGSFVYIYTTLNVYMYASCELVRVGGGYETLEAYLTSSLAKFFNHRQLDTKAVYSLQKAEQLETDRHKGSRRPATVFVSAPSQPAGKSGHTQASRTHISQ